MLARFLNHQALFGGLDPKWNDGLEGVFPFKHGYPWLYILTKIHHKFHNFLSPPQSNPSKKARVIVLPTQYQPKQVTMLRRNPSKLPSICSVWAPSKNGCPFNDPKAKLHFEMTCYSLRSSCSFVVQRMQTTQSRPEATDCGRSTGIAP